ncbi:Ankyrin repeat domain-containing protein 49 [Pseudolycoriella hygida]|uniref:Ankyrin repeat domain-containing protein 49 n=1 Tax=Pseudolycoriella hygida TaxID=35572 RepID=A0A9Q0MN75_9DIPT|nr:Ankyrin repeat domain-containing protein 49 [Pseudolycoriella hygida]
MDSDSENDSIDQLEEFRKANIKPGMFVSGWEDPNDEIYEDEDPHSTLERKILWATNEGKIDIVRTILNAKPSCVHAKDDDGYTPLHRACYNNNVELAQLLIQYGADVNALTNFKWTPLHSSCQWSNSKCVAMLLQYGANVNSRTDGDQTPLHIAASVSNCREMAMTLMLNPGVEPHLTNNSKETAADIARRTGLTFPVFEMAHSAFVDNVNRID